MKKIVVAFGLLAVCFGVFAGTIQVKVAVTAERNTFQVKKELQSKAEKEAVRKYILKLNAQTPEKLIEEACNEYATFVEDTEKLSEKWDSLDDRHGQLTGEFAVTLADGKINQWLQEKGFSHQAGIELVVMEEPPSLGQMKMAEAFGSGLNGEKFFLQNYTTFQRRLRDAIIKKAGTFGFDVKLLSDNELYADFKSKDETLVGTYFDVNENRFVVTRGLLDTVRANYPETVVLYYRIDALIYNPQTKNVRATVAFNFKDLNGSVTKSIGAQTYEFPTRSTLKDEVMDDIAYCAEAAMNTLMNSEGMAEKLNSLAMSIKNAADMPKGPLKLIVNASVFDAKIRKKAMYMLKKEIVARKLAPASKVRSTNTSLTAVIENPEITETDVLYMEHIMPILESIGVEISDDKVHYAADTLTLNP